MKLTRLISVLFLCLSISGCFTGWNKKDKALYLGFVGLSAVDTYQTFDAFDDPEKKELNVLMQNKTSVVAIKLLALGVIYWVADKCPKQRTQILGVCDGTMTGVVLWNSQVGK